jgi:polysaccharide deacetylase family protein (PEP-CTERM system associated)
MVNNIFTVDVEEYYHAENILRSLPEEEIKKLPDRVEIGVNKILNLLAKTDNKATFFVLGCVAEKNRDLIKKISDAGHEIASHGYFHTPLTMHTPASFGEDLGRSIKILSDISGQKILGYRATSFSLSEEMAWFFDVLRKYGIIYDSSIAKSFFRKPCSIRLHECDMGYFEISRGIMEFPVSCIKVGPISFPMGGGYFRLYPYRFTKWCARHLAASKEAPFVIYLHPWEIDPDQPKVSLPFVNSLRHYIGLSGAERKLEALLAETRFLSARDLIAR